MKMPQSKLRTLNSYNYKLGILEILGWLLLIIYMIPFYLMLINSFKTRREIFADTTGFPSEWNFNNYTTAIERMDMGSAFINSLIGLGSARVLNLGIRPLIQELFN